MAPGRIVTLSGVTGAGKTRIAGLLLKELPGARMVTSITTRTRRSTDVLPGEYNYITQEAFDVLGKDRKRAIMWREQHGGFWYATDWADVSEVLDQNDVHGIMILVPRAVRRLHDYVRRRMGDTSQLVSFFIRANDKETLERRVLERDGRLDTLERRWTDEKNWEAHRDPIVGYTMIDNPQGEIDRAVTQIIERLRQF